MIEIKFRVWDKIKREMIYDPNSWACIHLSDMFNNPASDWIWMQFTGLKDKNGKDLDWWEGDVFDLYGSNSPHVIIHKDGCFWFEHLRNKQRILCYKCTEFVDDIPYLGSIHEKPELLK